MHGRLGWPLHSRPSSRVHDRSLSAGTCRSFFLFEVLYKLDDGLHFLILKHVECHKSHFHEIIDFHVSPSQFVALRLISSWISTGKYIEVRALTLLRTYSGYDIVCILNFVGRWRVFCKSVQIRRFISKLQILAKQFWIVTLSQPSPLDHVYFA